MESELTESEVFVRSFVKEIAVALGSATIHDAIPMPEDSPVPREDAEKVALREMVLLTVPSGTPGGTRTPDARLRTPPLYPG